MRMLVTGGAGFIGSNFARYLLRARPDANVVVLDLLTYAGNRENLADLDGSPRSRFVRGDIRDLPLVRSLMAGVDVVVHFAAESHVDRSILGAAEFISTNVHGTYVLLDAAREAGVRRFLHVSTDEVYGSRAEGAFRETDPLSPSSPYAASKAAADLVALSFHKTYNLPVVITRSTNNYGPFQYPEKLIPLFITNALEGKPLPLYGDGLQRRDWIHVEDNCRAIDLVLERGEPGTIYNVGAGTDVTNLEVAERLLDLLGKPRSLLTHVADRPGHDRRYAVAVDRIRALGWAPRVDLPEGLSRTVAWYREHEGWWRAIKERQPEFREFYDRYYGTRLSGGG